MDYPAAIEYLLSFADFERSGRFKDRPDVAPMLALLRHLGDPHLGRTTVHVAGSKGKGSVSAMIDAVLRAAGLSTGLYTSPHLHDYRERIRIDGALISEAEFASLVGTDLHPAVEAAQAELGDRSFVTFDLLTALGFLAFRAHNLDAQVIEVGLGGRVDSTNVFSAKDVAVITPLSLEHTQILGDAIEAIAREKAAIITPGCATVLAPQLYPAAANIVRKAAAYATAELVDIAAAYRWKLLSHDATGQKLRIKGPHGVTEVHLPLLGAHQAENAATAVAAVDALRNHGIPIPNDVVSRGLASVHWPGRLETLREVPLVIADGAHNRDSARRLREALRDYFTVGRVLFIVGASSDKDIDGLAEELAPLATEAFAARTAHPRAMDPERIADAFQRLGTPVKVWSSIGGAIDAAIAGIAPGTVICLVGSLFVAAEAREHLGRKSVL